MEVVTLHAAKTNLSKLVARAEAGEEIILARGNKQVAKLVPLQTARPKRVPGGYESLGELGPEFFEPLPDEELRLWGEIP